MKAWGAYEVFIKNAMLRKDITHQGHRPARHRRHLIQMSPNLSLQLAGCPPCVVCFIHEVGTLLERIELPRHRRHRMLVNRGFQLF